MSSLLSTDTERSDHDPQSGFRSPLYGTATFSSLSPSSTPAPLSSSVGSSTRISYPARSLTPSTTDDGTHVRRVGFSPAVTSYESRSQSEESYDDDHDLSFDDATEVEDALNRIDDDITQLSSAVSSSGSSSQSYATATNDTLDFSLERRALSRISERTETPSLGSSAGSGIGASTGLFQNIFSSTFARPSSIFSAARSFYGSSQSSTLSPPPTIPTSSSGTIRANTPDRTFKPAPPTGRRVGNLIASFESDAIARPGSAAVGPRSPSPYSASSRPSSPTKSSLSSHSRGYTEGSYTDTSSRPHTHSRSYTDGSSSYRSPSVPSTSLSRSTFLASSETERPLTPLSNVRNIVTAWKERSPTKASSAGSASPSIISGGPTTLTSSSMSSAGLGLGGVFSLRRRAATTASSYSGRRTRSESGRTYTETDDAMSATGSLTDGRSLMRSNSARSAGSSIFDISELESFIRGNQEPLRVGQLWYLNVHAPPPFRWVRCRALLYPNTLLLSWMVPGGGRGVVTLDLVHCNEVRSVPSPSHPSARDDIGTIAARLQMSQGEVVDYDLLEMLCPFQLLYSDGVERLGAESARERVRWVSAIWEALDSAVGVPERGMTRSPTGSVRTMRSMTSSVVSSGSGSASTQYLPPSETIPELQEFESSYLSESSLSSFGRSRTISSDDGAISGGLLHPVGSRNIEIAPSRSSSLRRTSSLADLDAEFASALNASGITFDRGGRSSGRRFGARWAREGSEYGGTESVGPSESASRRVRSSSFYSGTSRPDTAAGYTYDAPTTMSPTYGLRTSYSESTEPVQSSLSLRGPESASLLGDCHSGPTSSEDAPKTPTRRVQSPDTLYSSSDLTRQSAVRRRTPRAARSYTSGSMSDSGQSTPQVSFTDDTLTNGIQQPSTLSTFEESYTTTSYDISEHSWSLTRSDASQTQTFTQSEESTIRAPITSPPADKMDERQKRVKTPTPSAPTVYHSPIATPTQSTVSLPSEYVTAVKAASSDRGSEVPATEFITAELCPSSPPKSETEFFTAQCHCKPAKAESEPVSLYEESPVPEIPSTAEKTTILLPEIESEESPIAAPLELELEKTPTLISREPSALTESSVGEISTEPAKSEVTRTPSSPTTETPSSLTQEWDASPKAQSKSISSIPLSSSSSLPSSPTSESFHSRTSMTPKSKSLFVPSHSSKSSAPSVSEYDSTIFLPSPSIFTVSLQDPAEVSMETSVMHRGVSELLSKQSSPFMTRGLKEAADASSISASTLTPTETSTGTASSLTISHKAAPLVPSTLTFTPTHTPTPAQFRPDPPTPTSLSSVSSLSVTEEESVASSVTASSPLLAVSRRLRSPRSATPSSLTASSALPPLYPFQHSRSASDAMQSVSTDTGMSPFDDETILGHQVTVSRTPSSVSTLSSTSISSSVFAPTIYEEAMESPKTQPTLLSSRAATPRPGSPREIALPQSPSLLSSKAPTPSLASSTPRTESESLHTETSVVPSEMIEAQREEILTHDVNRLLRYLHDLDQIRGDESRDMKDHLQRIEDELRDLSDFLREPKHSPLKAPAAIQTEPAGQEYLPPRVVHVHIGTKEGKKPLTETSESLAYASPEPLPVQTPILLPAETAAGTPISIPAETPARTPIARPAETIARTPTSVPAESIARTPIARPAEAAARTIPSESSSPLPVAEPTPRPPPQRIEQSEVPVIRDSKVFEPSEVPHEETVSYSPSSASEGLSFLSSHHSESISLISLENYPAIPISPPGSPSSPSSDESEWSSSTEAAFPPSSATPSSITRSATSRALPAEDRSISLSVESPFPVATPVPPAASPLLSIVSESLLPTPPVSSTPSLEAITTPLPASPAPEAPHAASHAAYAVSPLPEFARSISVGESEGSFATPPPSSSMPSSTTPPSFGRGIVEPAPYRRPSSPVLSISPEPSIISELPEPAFPEHEPILAEHEPEFPEPEPTYPEPEPVFPEPEPATVVSSPGLPVPPEPLPHRMPTPARVPSPDLSESEFEPVPSELSSPAPSITTVRPGSDSDREARERAIDGLRDLLEDLRGQTQSLWDSQLVTNQMLDGLTQDDVPARLRSIEGLLNNLLRDMASVARRSEEEPSEISSDTSSALRRYIDRLRDRRQESLHMPTPVRAPQPALDSEWLEFLSEPPPTTEQPVHGPPPVVPLYRRAPRPQRETSISPPMTLEDLVRPISAPLSEGFVYTDFPSQYEPSLRGRYPAYLGPRIPPRSELESVRTRRPRPRARPRRGEEEMVRPSARPSEGPEIDFLDRVHEQRRLDGRDPWVNRTRPAETLVDTPVDRPPRVHSAPPAEAQPQYYGPTAPVTTPGAPLPQPVTMDDAATRPPVQPQVQQVPVQMGPPPPFEHMLDLLRQNRLAQTASIDQQREIMRYMRNLNQWLEHDVRDRQNEMRSIGARVDALRAELGRVGLLGQPTTAGRPAGPGGQTFIVPPMPPQAMGPGGMGPGGMGPVGMGPGGGPPVIPSFPQPEMPFSPRMGQVPGSTRPVIPPYPATGVFEPPPLSRIEPPVIPSGGDPYRQYRPGEVYSPRPSSRPYPEEHGFIPPPPSDAGYPVPPPGVEPPILIQPPPGAPHVDRSDISSSRTPSPSLSPEHHPPSVHIHVPSQAPPTMAGPPDVHRVSDEPQLPPHPHLSHVASPPPSAVQQPPITILPPPQQPYTMAPDQPYPTPRQRLHVVNADERSPESPTRVIVAAPPTRYSRRSDSPHHRISRTGSGRTRRYESRSPSFTPPPRHRRDEYEERPAPTHIHIGSQPTEAGPGVPLVVQQPPSMPYTHHISRSSSRSRTPRSSPDRRPIIIQQPSQMPMQQPVMTLPPESHAGLPIPAPAGGPPILVQPGAPGYPPMGYPPSAVPPSAVPHAPTQPIILQTGRESPRTPRTEYIPAPGSTHIVSEVPHVTRSRSPSRSPARSRQRYRSPAYEEDGSRRHRRPHHRSRSPAYEEDDSRRHRRPYHRSPSYADDEGRPRPHRSPSYGEEEGPRRSPRRRPSYDDRYDRSRHHRHYDDEYERPSRRHSPSYYESDRPHRRLSRPSRVSPGRTAYSPSRSERPAELEAPPTVHHPATVIAYSPSRHVLASPRPTEAPEVHVMPSHVPSRRHEYVEGDQPSRPVTVSPTRVRTYGESAESPTRVYVHSRRESPTRTVMLPTQPPPARRVPGPEGQPVTYVPTVSRRPSGRVPSQRPPTVMSIGPSGAEGISEYAEEEPHEVYEVPVTPTMHPVRPPATTVPVQPSHVASEDEYEDHVPVVSRPPTRVPTAGPYEPTTPSGPGDLAFHDLLGEHQARIEEAERRLEELNRAAMEAEERRERSFREHEEERMRLFEEEEDRRRQEAGALHEEFEHRLHEFPSGRPPIEGSITEPSLTEGALPMHPPYEGTEGLPSVGPGVTMSDEGASIESGVPVPPPGAPSELPPGIGAAVDTTPQLNEILELLRAQQLATEQSKAEEADRFAVLRDEIDNARAETRQECEERIRMLEDELARTKEELELERGQRRAEELERIEREHAEMQERDEFLRNQLGDITNIVQEQRDELARKREVADQRWEEKIARRDEKKGRQDDMFDTLLHIVQDRERDRQEREAERAAAAARPSIETVLDELKRMNENHIRLVQELTDTWRTDSANQHQDMLDAVRATAQEMVPFNLTGYLDEFSKALAGEIRTLLGEVGRLHEQKRTIQFEISSLMHMHSKYGPGGQFEPDWFPPSQGPLSIPLPGPGESLPGVPPPGGMGMMGGMGGMGPPPPGPGPDEPPPPARPAWRQIQQRVPRRRRTGKTDMPEPSLAPPEPVPHPASWHRWEPNPAFQPTPPPPGVSPLVVPPSGNTGLFGPRSPNRLR